jgi:beta-lactam-binding protein with PASTA domain
MPTQRLANLAVYALAFFILFFLTAIIFSQVILKGETVSVPDLTGKTVQEAKADLAKKDLAVALRGTEFNDLVPRGQILFQDPAAGSKIRVTKVVQVVTSAGSQEVAVPDLAGKSLDAALDALKQAGLVKGKQTQVHTPRYAAGRVIAQDPPPGAVVERNAPVGLLLSQGEREELFLMPDLIYGRADRVIARLKALDFKVADIHYVYYPGLSSGIIVKQFPPNGYRIRKRNLITLEVSR